MQEQLCWKWWRRAGIVTSAEYEPSAVEKQNSASTEELFECDETKQLAVVASQGFRLLWTGRSLFQPDCSGE